MDLAQGLGVRSFEINPLVLFTGEALDRDVCESLDIENLIDLEKRIENNLADKYPSMDIDLYLPPALKGLKEISRQTLRSCSIHNICGILSNGDISVCGIGRRRRELVMGNIKKDSIAHIWRHGRLFEEIRRIVPFHMKGICGKCIFRYHCRGFCRSDMLYNNHSLAEPYDLCEELFRRGLFPETRILTENESVEAGKSIVP
jgi:radical SAM protein with 4Fe4S-binding SPASM domain